ncbi:MAG: hypothetical protein CMK07_02955 [Ponticaulis sp.]|nr:hypothetical protein [Ponticaulis sp.]
MLPDHVDPFAFFVVSILALAFLFAGALLIWLNFRVVFEGYKARLLKVGYITISSGEGSTRASVYKILDGARAGEYGRANVGHLTPKKVLIPDDPSRINTSRLKEKDKSEISGWAHRSAEFAVTLKDLIKNSLSAGILLAIGIGFVVLAVRLYIGR